MCPGPSLCFESHGLGEEEPSERGKGEEEVYHQSLSRAVERGGVGWGVKAWIGPWSEIVGRRE